MPRTELSPQVDARGHGQAPALWVGKQEGAEPVVDNRDPMSSLRRPTPTEAAVVRWLRALPPPPAEVYLQEARVAIEAAVEQVLIDRPADPLTAIADHLRAYRPQALTELRAEMPHMEHSPSISSRMLLPPPLLLHDGSSIKGSLIEGTVLAQIVKAETKDATPSKEPVVEPARASVQVAAAQVKAEGRERVVSAVDAQVEAHGRERIADLIAQHADELATLRSRVCEEEHYDAARHDDLFLLRFVLSHLPCSLPLGSTGRQAGRQAAVKAVKSTIAWRARHGLDEPGLLCGGPDALVFGPVAKFYASMTVRDAVSYYVPDADRGAVLVAVPGLLDFHQMVATLSEEEQVMASSDDPMLALECS